MTRSSSIALCLTDSRIGNSKQSVALAKIMGFEYTSIKIEYNLLALLPDMLWFNNCAIKQATIDQINNVFKQANAPNIIISAGRRMSHVARFIKYIKPECKIIQIMRPGISIKYIDVMILPTHDQKSQENAKICYYFGALCIPPEQQNQVSDYTAFIQSSEKKSHAVILIGELKPRIFKSYKDIAQNLVELIQGSSDATNCSIAITTSRRTSKALAGHIASLMQQTKSVDYFIYNYHTNQYITRDQYWQNAMCNPYDTMLKNTDYIVSTCDSISMISEALYKPLYIYYPKQFCALVKKKRSFCSQLENTKMAKLFTGQKLSSEKKNSISKENRRLKERVLEIIKA